MSTTEHALAPREQLRSRGMRVTSPRIAVLDVVASQPHMTAEEVALQLRERLGAVSTQTVYDALRACAGAGLLRRIEPAGHPARYEARTDDNHHHVVCRTCGRIEDVDCAINDTPCLQASHDHDFVIDQAEVIYWGHCPDCQGSDPPPP